MNRQSEEPRSLRSDCADEQQKEDQAEAAGSQPAVVLKVENLNIHEKGGPVVLGGAPNSTLNVYHGPGQVDKASEMSTTKKQATQPECPNHDVARLFCMTCYVVFCRDCAVKTHPEPSHVHIELPRVNSTQKDFEFLGNILEELLKRQTNILDVNDKLGSSVERSKQEVRNTAEELRAKVTMLENDLVEKIESTRKDRKSELNNTCETFGTLSESMQTSLETAKTVANTALDRDSLCSTVIRDLEQLSSQHRTNIDNMATLIFKKHEIADGDIKLGKVLCTTGGRWELSREFGKEGRNPGEFEFARAIAVRGSDLAVADYDNNQVVICSMDGKQSCNIPLENPRSIAVSQPGNRLVVVCPSAVKVFNADNLEDFNFSTFSSGENVNVWSVAVGKEGSIFVGDVACKVLSEHRPTDGSILRTIRVEIEPSFLAVNNIRLVIGSVHEAVVHVIDSNGITLFRIQPIIGGQPVKYCLGVYTNSSGIYIAVYKGTYHIHHYDAQGGFLSCIAKNLKSPYGITMTPSGELVVADRYSIKIYQQQL